MDRSVMLGGILAVLVVFVFAGSVVSVGHPPPCGSFGDIDGDGSVTSADNILVLKIIVDVSGFTPAQIANADVNGDGLVNVFDSITVSQYVNGTITTFLACGAPPPPSGPGALCTDPIADCAGKACTGNLSTLGVCKGPCTTDLECAPLLSALSWVNAVCTGTTTNPGTCIEAPAQVIPAGPQKGSEFLVLINTVTNWIFAILLLAAVLFVLLAAFQFLTGGGDPAGIAMARQKLIYAAVAIAIATLARGVPTVVRSIIGA